MPLGSGDSRPPASGFLHDLLQPRPWKPPMTETAPLCPTCLERIRERLLQRARIREREAESESRDILNASPEELLRLLGQEEDSP